MKYLLLTLCVLLNFIPFSRAQIPTGTWRSHKSYVVAEQVVKVENTVYCKTLDGTFTYNIKDNSVEPLTKISGISGNAISKVFSFNNTAILLYDDANIDIIQGNTISNIPDIKLKQMTGIKQLYTANTLDNICYIGASFGIVVLDLARQEIKDTWNPMPQNATNQVFDIAFLNDTIYAATNEGVYYASLSNAFLNDFNQWRKFETSSGAENGRLVAIETFNQKLFSFWNNKILELKEGRWVENKNIETLGLKNIKSTSLGLIAIQNFAVRLYSSDLVNIKNFPISNFPDFNIQDAFLDETGICWIADQLNYLVRSDGTNLNSIKPNGLITSNNSYLNFTNNTLFMGSSALGDLNFYLNGLHEFEDETWKIHSHINTAGMDTFYDVLNGVKSSNGNLYIASYRRGLGMIDPNNTFTAFSRWNSNLKAPDQDPSNTRVIDLAIDQKNKLYVLNNGVSTPVAIFNGNNQFTQYSFPGVFVNPNFANCQRILVDSYNKKWVTISGDGLLVFDDNQGLKYKKLQLNIEAGPEFSNSPICLAEDNEGNIWVGTDKGIYVYYNSLDILNEANPAPSQIRVIQDGLVQYLLESDFITSIAIDGGNRKWIGTNNGLWLFDKDDVTPLNYFNSTNSPLSSDVIIDLAIHPTTGEVFISTEKGLWSYRSDASKGDIEQRSVKVFPNPVRPDFKGPITIQGFVGNAEIKITDVNGNMVYQTVANGGTATWSGNNFSGERASTGVYYVFITNTDGSTTKIEKIMLIN